MKSESVPTVEMIPIDRITVVNPRVRNKKIFKTITENIAQIGLKRPITVSKRKDKDGVRYDLVCGQGRLEAYQNLGQTEIPALVVNADAEDCMVMSLVENLARRQHRAIDLLQDIEGLKQRGYNDIEIAKKTGLTLDYVRGISGLLAQGEQRLLRAVEAGQIPLSVAVDIADSGDAEVQNALQHAYENNLLRGRKLLVAKRLIEQRRQRGKSLRNKPSPRGQGTMSSAVLLRAYKQDTEKKSLMIRKAELARNKLVFVTQALRTLFADEHFITLLRAEGLETLPSNLAERMHA
jgi:ParB family transcriptional regulator, chromosome partitioning protein